MHIILPIFPYDVQLFAGNAWAVRLQRIMGIEKRRPVIEDMMMMDTRMCIQIWNNTSFLGEHQMLAWYYLKQPAILLEFNFHSI